MAVTAVGSVTITAVSVALQIASATSGNAMVDAANKVMADALALNPLLKNAAGAVMFQKPFPATPLGSQLQDIARVISLNAQLAVGRQVFFCRGVGGVAHPTGAPRGTAVRRRGAAPCCRRGRARAESPARR